MCKYNVKKYIENRRYYLHLSERKTASKQFELCDAVLCYMRRRFNVFLIKYNVKKLLAVKPVNLMFISCT